MRLSLRIIEADNIPKMDTFGKADPFVSVYLTESHEKDQTEYKSKTYTPKWEKQMHLKVINISEFVKIELKDHDAGGKSELIGSIQRKIKDFQPGIVKDEWITVEKAKKVKKAARIHIVSHLAYEEMCPFVQIPFIFYKIVVNIQGIRGMAKANPSETFNPYILIGLERSPSIRFKTKELKNTKDPVWNEDFPVEITNPSTDLLSILVRDKYNSKEIESAVLSLPIYQYQPFYIYDNEYDMAPLNGVKSAGKIKLKIQVLPIDAPNWSQMPPQNMYPQQQMPPQGMYQQQQMPPQGSYPPQQPGMYPPQQGNAAPPQQNK
ncbi:hypothetical protein M9Y10_016019 [Tritrichomonas musculus]|uniref:C2 domain-containing protein n=1 Tax=Tritrichomonas musculus TaxID=1915356 RepID=A0ABR2I550_9EUKA